MTAFVAERRIKPEAVAWLGAWEAKAAALLRGLAFRPYAAPVVLIVLCCALFLPGIAALPVTDRDEARFAQASKQMLETGNFVDIRFQSEPRYKKPIGIYWLQSASAGAAQVSGASPAEIWPYRIPSFVGALAAVLLTFWAGRATIGRRDALVAAALFASCLTLAFEARIAKSDAALIAAIMLMQGALFRLYLAPPGAPTRGLAALFWLGLGASVLIKGPVGPAVALLTAAVVLYRDRNRAWLKRLRWGWGVPLLLAITLPWFVAIGIASHGAFFKSSLGQDFAGKLQSGQESHWAPPGFYLSAFWWTFWPSALFVTVAAARAIWRARRSRRVLFLLAWIVPFFLLIEVVPTKLPHYVLPLYPAVALAASYAVGRMPQGSRRWRLSLVPWLGLALIQALALLSALWLAETPALAIVAALLAVFGGLAVVTAAAAWRSYAALALLGTVGCAALFQIAAFGVALPAAEPLWLSDEAVAAARMLRACGAAPPGFAGLASPSLVFLNGTGTVLAPPRDLGAALASRRVDLAFVNWKDRAAFEAAFQQAASADPRLLGCVDGIDLNGKGPARLQIYARPGPEAAPTCAPPAELRCREKAEVRWRRILNTAF